MMLRNGLLGAALVLVVAGSVNAEPPVNPLVEGREPNPVVREFYETEPATYGYVAEAGSEVKTAASAGWWVSRAAWESLFNQLTMPLGSVQIWD